eukprot:2815802-Pleurochrysis_carterae.AAC.1
MPARRARLRMSTARQRPPSLTRSHAALTIIASKEYLFLVACLFGQAPLTPLARCSFFFAPGAFVDLCPTALFP